MVSKKQKSAPPSSPTQYEGVRAFVRMAAKPLGMSRTSSNHMRRAECPAGIRAMADVMGDASAIEWLLRMFGNEMNHFVSSDQSEAKSSCMVRCRRRFE